MRSSNGLESMQLCLWIRQKKRKPGGKDSPVKIISRYIDENYDKSITLDILADLVKMNAAYVSVIFKKKREFLTVII